MFLSNFSIRNPVATVVVVLLLICLGLLALKNLRVNQNPDVEQPLIVINIPYPGASPETVEREIIDRVEKPLQSIPQVHDISSSAAQSNAQIVVIFEFGKNLVEAADEIRNAIASVRHKLPIEMREPVLSHIDTSAQPMMGLALSSTAQTHAELSHLAEDVLAEQLRAVAGVAEVTVQGALHRELSVLLRAGKLREYNVSVNDVVTALRAHNTTAPVGRIRGELEEESIRLVGRIESPDRFADIVVRRHGDEVVRLGQLGEIRDGFAELSDVSLLNAHPNVGLAVIRARGASTVTVGRKVRELVGEINQNLPRGTRLKITWDNAEDAELSLRNVIDALVFGAILTIFVVYAFLNSWRSTLITALSLPTSVVAAFIAVWACGFTLNFMTLLALSLAIGVLIDDAIVVRENIVRHMERGVPRRLAAQRGTAEIGPAVTATTLSIVAVFVPVAFMGGVAGEWFRPFALTVVAAVLVSLLVSFTLDPMLSAYWGDPVGPRTRVGIARMLARFNGWFDGHAHRYGEVIGWALRHRKSMAAIAICVFVLALALQIRFGGTSFLPSVDSSMLAIDVRTPSSASLQYSTLKLEEAAALARTLPEIGAASSWAAEGGGQVWLELGKRRERHRSSAEIAADLRGRLARLVGAEYVVFEDLNNGPQKPVQLQFSGPDARRLMEIASDFMERMRQIPGAVDVGLSQQDPKDEIKIELDRGLADRLGISAADVAQTLRVAFAGVEAGDWVDPLGETRDVAVRLHPDDRLDAGSIGHLPVATADGNAVVPLGQIARITFDKGPARIQHLNGKRTVTVAANVQGRASGEVTADALRIAQSMRFAPGYGLELGGASRDQQEVFGGMLIALGLGVVMMYMVLVIQFGSFLAPLPVILSLPLSLIGVVVALSLTHGTLNLMSLIGVIMLMGLVAKNAILLLDCARKQEADGLSRAQALVYAGRIRLRPILMTSIALIAGMTPVAIGLGEGAEFYRPMAMAIIGGTITSTLLALLVVPTFYDTLEAARERAQALIRGWLQRSVTSRTAAP